VQLNYGHPDLQVAMSEELRKIARLCDGVCCDMAMLILPDVFERTWGIRAQPFWPRAIETVRRQSPEFLFMAEVYWDLEWTLQQQGFDYTYDKRLYDRLRDGHARPVRDHLRAGMDFQHQESRASVACARLSVLDRQRRYCASAAMHFGRVVSVEEAMPDGQLTLTSQKLKTPRAGGDCHLLNIGDSATSERQPVFDINDSIVARRMSWEATNRPSCS
jgi:Uncharacterized protein conserved in bacteria (DUF2252)